MAEEGVVRTGESLGAAGRRAELWGGTGTRARGPCCREGSVLVRVAALRRMRSKASQGEERDPSHLWQASCGVAARVSGVSECQVGWMLFWSRRVGRQ